MTQLRTENENNFMKVARFACRYGSQLLKAKSPLSAMGESKKKCVIINGHLVGKNEYLLIIFIYLFIYF
jgi:hypothetical protein